MIMMSPWREGFQYIGGTVSDDDGEGERGPGWCEYFRRAAVHHMGGRGGERQAGRGQNDSALRGRRP
jgi:hypothetical protein